MIDREKIGQIVKDAQLHIGADYEAAATFDTKLNDWVLVIRPLDFSCNAALIISHGIQAETLDATLEALKKHHARLRAAA